MAVRAQELQVFRIVVTSIGVNVFQFQSDGLTQPTRIETNLTLMTPLFDQLSLYRIVGLR